MNEEDTLAFIEQTVSLAKEDTLKGFVYFQKSVETLTEMELKKLQLLWQGRSDWRKEVDLVGKGHRRMQEQLLPKILKMKRELVEELYKEFFANE